MEASVDGVLGGYGHVNDVDVKGSEAFLKTLFSERFADTGRNRHLVALCTPSRLFAILFHNRKYLQNLRTLCMCLVMLL